MAQFPADATVPPHRKPALSPRPAPRVSRPPAPKPRLRFTQGLWGTALLLARHTLDRSRQPQLRQPPSRRPTRSSKRTCLLCWERTFQFCFDTAARHSSPRALWRSRLSAAPGGSHALKCSGAVTRADSLGDENTLVVPLCVRYVAPLVRVTHQ